MFKLKPKESALLEVGQFLRRANYKFITPTPLTHQKYLKKISNQSENNSENSAIPSSLCHLRDIFGWNIPFEQSFLPKALWKNLTNSDSILGSGNSQYKSRIRFSSIDEQLFLHSGFPTDLQNSVFFGPDTYRFVRFVKTELNRLAMLEGKTFWPRILDIGCGTGVAGITLGDRCSELVLSDINPLAISYTTINHRLNLGSQINTKIILSDLFSNISGDFDLILANPPFMMDEKLRIYRNGGSHFGSELSLKIVKESLQRLNPGGQLIMYSASAIVNGRDLFREAIFNLESQSEFMSGYSINYHPQISYEEIDPDIFGEDLELPSYLKVERLAAVGVVIQRPANSFGK